VLCDLVSTSLGSGAEALSLIVHSSWGTEGNFLVCRRLVVFIFPKSLISEYNSLYRQNQSLEIDQFNIGSLSRLR
jgi:hypothetical protein